MVYILFFLLNQIENDRLNSKYYWNTESTEKDVDSLVILTAHPCLQMISLIVESAVHVAAQSLYGQVKVSWDLVRAWECPANLHWSQCQDNEGLLLQLCLLH